MVQYEHDAVVDAGVLAGWVFDVDDIAGVNRS